SLVQVVEDERKQVCPPSLQRLAHSPPPAHGSPACTAQLPPLHVSAPLQKVPSLQGALLFAWMQEPLPLQWSSVQTLPSLVHAAVAGRKQFCGPSLQRLAHSPPPAHGSPPW